MFTVSSTNAPVQTLQSSSVNNTRPTPPRFADALVKPDAASGGSSLLPTPKQAASWLMAAGRYCLAGAVFTYVSSQVATNALPTMAVAAAVNTATHLLGGPQLLPSTGELIVGTLAMGHTAGFAASGAVIKMLSPYESNPDKIFNDNGRVGELSKMFVDVQKNEGVSQGQKNVLAKMDSLGQHAYRKQGQDSEGRPIYVKMSQDEYRAALLHGAHVVVKGTDTLEQIKTDGGGGMINRSGPGQSSHYTRMDDGIAREQWGLDLPMKDVGGPNGGSGNGFGHLLIGKTSHGDTFFQLEGHGTGDKWQKFLHGMDLFSHLNSLANVGPHGVIDMVEGSQTHIIIDPGRG